MLEIRSPIDVCRQLVCVGAFAWTSVIPLRGAASEDAYGTGNGQDGALAVTAANTLVNESASLTAPATAGDISLTVDTPGRWRADARRGSIWQRGSEVRRHR